MPQIDIPVCLQYREYCIAHSTPNLCVCMRCVCVDVHLLEYTIFRGSKKYHTSNITNFSCSNWCACVPSGNSEFTGCISSGNSVNNQWRSLKNLRCPKQSICCLSLFVVVVTLVRPHPFSLILMLAIEFCPAHARFFLEDF